MLGFWNGCDVRLCGGHTSFMVEMQKAERIIPLSSYQPDTIQACIIRKRAFANYSSLRLKLSAESFAHASSPALQACRLVCMKQFLQ
jgi:hypothetical protein